MEKIIYICGMHSGQSPCAGLGIAKSLRKAFPEVTLVGVDHWQGSSGLHHDALDDFLLLPQWNQIDRDRHASFIRSLLDAGHLWIPAIDMEIYWLAKNLGKHVNLLAPDAAALELTAKPTVKAFEGLGLSVPEYISAFVSDAEAHSFLRHNSWQCWLKGPYHEAKRISSWDGFERGREAMRREWKSSRLFVQRHVVGDEESICFAANQGKLLAAVHLQKRIITPQGKTWAGRVSQASPDLLEELRKVMRRLHWSGGAEIEFVRDSDGKKWMIECNPRFPAWIYGSALTGTNLPARLVADACGQPFLESARAFPCFTRVVQEIPVKEGVGLPPPPDPSLLAWSSEAKKGGGPSQVSLMPPLGDSMPEEEGEDEPYPPAAQAVPPLYVAEIENRTRAFSGETPKRIHLEDWTLSRFGLLAMRVRETQARPVIRIAYSVKTSPTDEHLRKAKKFGFLTECISQREVSRALQAGVRPGEIILNGPGKFWPLTSAPTKGLRMLFCDSTEEFEKVLLSPDMAEVLGMRIRLPKLPSRFGVSVEDFAKFQDVVGCIRRMSSRNRLGFHFHLPSWAIGVERWMEALRSLATWCQAIEQLTRKPVEHLDFGGGFFPADLETIGFRMIQDTIRESLPRVRAIYFEPGRSLTQEGEAVVSRVLDVRRDKKREVSEIVVDASIAELPLIQSYYHRVFYRSLASGSDLPVSQLNKGSTRVLGRICMENDILSHGLEVPESVRVGDLVIFGDAGAYERSMSYEFGRG